MSFCRAEIILIGWGGGGGLNVAVLCVYNFELCCVIFNVDMWCVIYNVDMFFVQE